MRKTYISQLISNKPEPFDDKKAAITVSHEKFGKGGTMYFIN